MSIRLCLLAMLACIPAAIAQTSFTYQGELASNAIPAAGLHDFRFTLHDAPIGGVQLGSVQCRDNIALADGRFTVEIDFGPEFTAADRYLEISVRTDTGLDCGSSTGFTALAPRQKITSAPRAAFALSATNAATATNATNATNATTAATATNASQLNGQSAAFYQNAANLNAGAIPSDRLSGSYTALLSFTNAGNTFTGSGAGLIALNASNISLGTLGDARLSANAALLNTPQAFSAVKTFAAPPAFTAAGSPFSVNNDTLVPNLNADKLDGLHASAFLQSIPMPLFLSGSSGATPFLIGADNTSEINQPTAIWGQVAALTGVTYGVQGRSFSTDGRGVYGLAGAATGQTHGVEGYSLSSDGHGVSGTAAAATGITSGVHGISESTDGRGVYGEATSQTGAGYGGYFRTLGSSGAGLRALGVSTGGSFEVTGPSGYAVRAHAPSTTGTTWGGLFISESNMGVGVQGEAQNSAGSGTGVYGITHAVTGIGVRGHASLTGPGSGASYGGHFSTFGESGRGVYGLAHSATGTGAIIGIEGRASNSTSGIGVSGDATAATGPTIGIKGTSSSSSGTGVYGEATSTGSFDSGVGGYFISSGGSGTAVRAIATGSGNGFPIGGSFRIEGTAGAALDASSTNLTGNGFAVRAVSTGATGTAVYGSANLQGTGLSYGGRFESASSGGVAGHFRGRGPDAVFIENYGTGRGMRIVSTNDTAVWAETTSGFAGIDGRAASPISRAIYGHNSATTGDAFGVVGSTASPAGWGLFAFGKSGASGVKSFRIDHPADPENKYLHHYSSESPEVINFYRGSITLDHEGAAIVPLPDYFARINRDPSYQLTAVGVPMPMLHIALEIDPAALAAGAAAAPDQPVPFCSFRIAGGLPQAKVSWRVEAVRNDRWMQQHSAPVETEKPAADRGTYQHPDLYNQPPNRATNHTTPAPSAAPPPESSTVPLALRAANP